MTLTTNNPKVNLQRSSLKINSHHICRFQLEISIHLRRLDCVAAHWISKHAITCHLDIECMLFTISERLWEYPFHSFATTGKTLQRLPILTPYKSFTVRVPVELEVLFLPDVFV